MAQFSLYQECNDLFLPSSLPPVICLVARVSVFRKSCDWIIARSLNILFLFQSRHPLATHSEVHHQTLYLTDKTIHNQVKCECFGFIFCRIGEQDNELDGFAQTPVISYVGYPQYNLPIKKKAGFLYTMLPCCYNCGRIWEKGPIMQNAIFFFLLSPFQGHKCPRLPTWSVDSLSLLLHRSKVRS